MILSIDAGNVYSGYCLIDKETYRPVEFGKIDNLDLLVLLRTQSMKYDVLVIEYITSYGMPVGKSIFDTCIWMGRFIEAQDKPIAFITRAEEKTTICGSMKAKDSNIRQALINRFATFDFKNGKGTKSNPDFFYGFKADIWSAYCVGITFLDKEKEK